MKSLGFMLSAVLMSLATVAFAQSAPSDAQKSFDKLKTLAGSWEGQVSGVQEAPDVEGKLARITLRTTSMGNALMHEMKVGDRPDDPITMIYLDENRLMLTHYCDAGNRPRMIGKISPDGKKVEFQFLDVAGSTQYGHMHSVVFTIIDENHHTEDWTFMVGDKPARPHFNLQRTGAAVAAK